MKRLACLALFLGLCLPVWADGSAAFAQKATDLLKEQQAQGLEIRWRGLGRVAGEILEATFVNTTDKQMDIRLVPGMVLEDADGRLEPLILEGVVVLRIEPGQKGKQKLRGYGLDHSRPSPSGKNLNYRLADSQPYEQISFTSGL